VKRIALAIAIAIAALTAGLFASGRASTSFAAATTTISNTQIPFALGVVVPCANGGAGELVLLTGTLHVVIETTVDNQGGVHTQIHFQPQDVSGVGTITGDAYRAVGVTRSDINATSGGAFETDFVNNFRIIGQGPGNNLQVHQVTHVTIDANGNVTAVVTNSTVTCS